MLSLLRLARGLLARSTVETGEARARGAHRIVLAGDVLAVLLVAAAVVRNNVLGQSLTHDALSAVIMGATGLLLVQGAGELGIRALVGSHLRTELDRGNLAAALAAAAHYVSVGLLASHAVAGQDWRGWGLSLMFFALSIGAQLAVVSLFRALTTYDDAEHVRGGNIAAALSYAGASIAASVVISRALQGDFAGWRASLVGFAQLCAWTLVLYPVRQLVVQGLWLRAAPTARGGAIDDAISQERDVGTAALEATTFVGAALAIVALA
jgi:uncharacterized membrane protein YjfL (UPF0719 family)